jgi:hypothetical protein
LSIVLDARGKKGFLQELITRLEAVSGQVIRYFHLAGSGKTEDFFYDPESMKTVLEEICLESGVHLQYHTRAVAARLDQSRLLAVISESKSGRQAWPGKVFIDATGDGDLGALAGCQFDYGHPQTGQAQPMSMVAILTGLDPQEVKPFLNGHPDFSSPGHHDHETKLALAEALHKAGAPISYSLPVLFHLHSSLFAFCANHEYGFSGLDAAEVTRATLLARQEVVHQVQALRQSGGAWKNVQLVSTPASIGVRDGRRIHGLYRVSESDLVSGKSHPDAICRVHFPVDVHATDPRRGKAYGEEGIKSRPYDIPLRALIARDVQGLLLAGRCISGDFLAHASYRVTGNAVQMGWAAGVTAALAARQGCLPQEVPFQEIRNIIDDQR